MNGFFNLNKPVGISSAGIVGVMKRLTGEKRVGHAGTLDPAAAGVLPVMVGRATRLFDYLVDRGKEYEAVCAFGSATDTQDATGIVTERGTEYPSEERVMTELRKLTGSIIQRPSMYSAIKVNGQRLYSLARKGDTVEVPERKVQVQRIDLLGLEPDHAIRIHVVCGKGTYIRSLCDDLGKLCGCPAHMRSLIRLRSGFFSIENSLGLDEARLLASQGLLEDKIIPMDMPLSGMARMEAPKTFLKAVSAGAALPLDQMSGLIPDEGCVTRVYLDDTFWGIAERREDKLIWRALLPPEGIK